MKRNYLYITILMVLVSLSGCGSKANKPDAETKTEEGTQAEHGHETEVEFTALQYKAAGIQLGTIEERELGLTIKANGVLDVPPQNLVSISVPFGGFLRSTDLLQGTRVKKGQLIATIQNPDYIQFQQDYLESKSQLEFLEAEYKRQEELAAANINAKKTLQKAKAEYLSARARVQGLKARLQLININPSSIENGNFKSTVSVYSPITGYVTAVNVNVGSFVNPTDVLFKIVDTEHLHAELTIYEKDMPKLKIGQKVRVYLSNDKKERVAKVHLIGREVSNDRTITVHCHLDEEDISLIPGTFLSGIVETGASKVASLPDEAIVQNGESKVIFVSEGSRKEGNEVVQLFKAVEVTTGVSDGGFTEIIVPEGMNKKASVVLKGAFDILSKMNSGEEAGHAH
ncbi:efflux RND transporter periplasmic adaptor subunit [Solitalea canadensis]|uniref:RND family efflux transporter, MFP subunit n=1 Tax=Solitalea canadensis (strain ATCC 29591 / DSM 3403 / JCM 21819 / LMG 8368 / NBRC 15130 / NCIMB 12057 / USAM 9D) TaxID=929556 RepID=H8KT11_SOLCM|nr:efflux RND transporter periplasmic adaptor subunit [Solitalea canadensis]AFD05582.1 RND family efflux transporter, MFP subunit [Solitalea canadensis DSM 3403]